MPIISEDSWSGKGKWLPVKRILFQSQIGDVTEKVVLYTSTNPVIFDTTVDPGSGLLVWNNVDPTLITQLAVSITDRDGGDQTLAWGDVKIGDEIIIRDDPTLYYSVTCAAEPVFNTSWYQIDVTFDFAISTITNNKNLDVTINYFPNAIPKGGDKLEIKVAMEWPWIVYRLFDEASIVPKERGLIPMDSVEIIEML